MVVWALLLVAALAEASEPRVVAAASLAARVGVEVVAAPTSQAERAVAARRPLVVHWQGGSARVERWTGRRWALLDANAASPYRTRPLPAGTTVRVLRGAKELGRGEDDGCWWPVDVAAWSGPGLRGARVTALDAQPGRLTAGTAGGGIAAWDGERWSHLSPRLGGVHSVSGLARGEDGLWIGGAEGLRGPGVSWPHEPVDELLWSGGTLWMLSDGRLGAWRDGAPEWLSPRGCAGLVQDEHGDAVVSCGGRGLVLPDLTHDRRPGAHLPLAGVALRRDGTWAAGRDGALLHITQEGASEAWRAPSGRLHGIARAGDGFVVAAGDDGAWLHGGRDAIRMGPAAGVLGGWAGAAVPGPASSKAWLGTDRGVHLVTAGGTGTSLPLAPLAAGVPIRAVVPYPGGTAVVATDAEVRFLGKRPPKGFELLSAAVVEQVTDLARDATGGLWVLGRRHAWRLDPAGRLRVFRLDGEARAISAVGRWLAVATADGLRFWTEGATVLSPVQRFPGIDLLRGTSAGAMWIGAGDQVHLWVQGELHSWDLPDLVHDVLPSPKGAQVATARGAVWIDVSEPTVRRVPELPGVPMRLAYGAGRAWSVDAELVISGRASPVELRRRLGDASVTAFAGDAHGVWVGTDAGLVRVVASPR